MKVVPENDLGIIVELRLDHIDRLMLIDGAKTALCQLLSNTRTQHRRPVQTKNSIYRRIIDKMRNQSVGGRFGLAESGFLGGNINIIVNMAVVGCKMAPGITQGYITMGCR